MSQAPFEDDSTKHLRTFTWICPWVQCKANLSAYTENGLTNQIEAHWLSHKMDKMIKNPNVLELSQKDRDLLNGMKIKT